MTDKSNTREQLIDVAHQTIMKYGLKKTTLDDIATLFGKGKTAIYYYFNNREDIIKAVLEKEASQAINAIAKAVDGAVGEADKLCAFVETRMQMVAHTPILNQANQQVKLKDNELINNTMSQFDNEKIRLLTNILASGINKRTFKIEEPKLAAIAIETALKGIDANITDDMDIRQQSDKLLKLLFHGILV